MSRINPINTFLKDKSEIIIRCAEEKDAPSLVNLKFEVTKELIHNLREPDEFADTIDIEIKRVKDLDSEKDAIYLVAEFKDELVGFLQFEPGAFKKIHHTGSIYMSVAEGFRNNGIGHILLNTLIGWATQNTKIEKILLNVFSNNERAIYLYKKLGFIIEGRFTNAIKLSDGSYLDSLWMLMSTSENT